MANDWDRLSSGSDIDALVAELVVGKKCNNNAGNDCGWFVAVVRP